ncbi:hypothetical protein [Burkholderia singularis]|uniref:hypothetical protein n=1 Tax=Burkholderia singularis TaxID=1503053 RepID=UPI0013590702|nr:hypothetical protein [Burkholderia singularis]
MNLFINLTYFSVRLLILLLIPAKPGPLPSSAHTYRLFIVKEHFLPSFPARSAALRCQQQRSEIMNPFSSSVNNFLNISSSQTRAPLPDSLAYRFNSLSSSRPRFLLSPPLSVSVSAKEA